MTYSTCEPSEQTRSFEQWNSGSRNRCEVAVESSPSAVQAVENKIVSRLEECGVDQRDVFSIRLSVHEALLNAVRHGNRLDPDKKVHILCKIDSDRNRFLIEIEDEGNGFCPDEIDDPRLAPYLNRPGGRGLLLIQTFMDTIEFNEAGNRVTMSKKYALRPADRSSD